MLLYCSVGLRLERLMKQYENDNRFCYIWLRLWTRRTASKAIFKGLFKKKSICTLFFDIYANFDYELYNVQPFQDLKLKLILYISWQCN